MVVNEPEAVDQFVSLSEILGRLTKDFSFLAEFGVFAFQYADALGVRQSPVSYTHLTLPTNREV